MTHVTPTLDALLVGLFADVGGSGEAAIPAGVDERAARELLVARVRRGEMSLQSRLVAITIADKVGVGAVAPALLAVLADAGVDATGRSCALQLASRASPDEAASALSRLPDGERERVEDARTAMELAMQTPSFDVSAALHANLQRAPAARREQVFARIERCRALACLPPLLAWTRALADPSLAPLHGRMVAAIVDEAGRGTALAAELLCRFAPAGSARPMFARVVAAQAGRRAPAVGRPAGVGRAHRIDRPDGSVELTACVRHPDRIWMVSQLGWVGEGEPAVAGVFITPGEPSIGIGGPPGVVTLSYRGATLEECLDELAARTARVELRTDAMPWGLVVTLCLLDGLAPARAEVGADA